MDTTREEETLKRLDISEFRAGFNREPQTPRLIAILSPT
jgi:hypothetical protein